MSDFYKKYSEISNFKTAPFGYDKKDVAAYIKRLQSVLEDAKRTQRELQQQLDEERNIKLSIIQQKETTRLQLLELQKLQEQFSNPESPAPAEHLCKRNKLSIRGNRSDKLSNLWRMLSARLNFFWLTERNKQNRLF